MAVCCQPRPDVACAILEPLFHGYLRNPNLRKLTPILVVLFPNRRSDFLGCLWFPVKNVLKKEINGSFKLQNQLCLTNPPIMCENSQSSVDEVVSLTDDQSMEKQSDIAFSKKAIHQQDADENLFLRFLELDPIVEPTPTPAVAPLQSTPSSQRRQSSIKNVLMHSPPPTQQVPHSSPASTALRNSAGRTPFTITKRLQRHQEKGYGFSIVWTHPPRVEKVEANLAAERAGIQPGDFVIFVDKHNVVTMPELDILNLIRSQGPTLTLEIFRRPPGQSGSRPLSSLMKTPSIGSERRERLPSNSSITNTQETNGFPQPNNNNNYSGSKQVDSVSHVNSVIANRDGSTASNLNGDSENNNSNSARPLQSASILNYGARSSIGCSNASISMETTKRRLHLPQVTFSKEVGHGVIV